MAWGYGEPAPKPAKGESRHKRRSLRLKLGKACRDAVWLQALEDGDGEAFCCRCQKGPLLRTTNILHPMAGHVAHKRGRNVAPADRFNPEACELACRDCHMGEHHMRFC